MTMSKIESTNAITPEGAVNGATDVAPSPFTERKRKRLWLNEHNQAFYSQADYSDVLWADGPFEIVRRTKEAITKCEFEQIDEDIYECVYCHKLMKRDNVNYRVYHWG